MKWVWVLIRYGVFFLTIVSTGKAASVEAVVQWENKITLSTPLSGVVREVLVDRGAHVTAGTVLMRLDQRIYKAKLEAMSAEVAAQWLDEQAARKGKERADELYKRTVLSDTALQQAHLAYQQAVARLKHAMANQAKAAYQLQYSEIIAPFSGLIIEKRVDLGQVIVSGLPVIPLFTLVKNDSMLAVAELDFSLIEKVSINQDVNIKSGNKFYKGKVKFVGIEPVIFRNNQPKYELAVSFFTNNNVLGIGQTVMIEGL